MRLWPRKAKVETRSDVSADEVLLRALLYNAEITRDMALNIPSFSGCVELITNSIASLPVKLFVEAGKEVGEVKDDVRLKLLNDETGDTLNAYQMKKAFIRDYLIDGRGYIYINREGNNVKSLHYVEKSRISITHNDDPIFKSVDIRVNGRSYLPFEFLRITRNTRNGFDGIGILDENKKILSVAYNSLVFEDRLVVKGGNKKGFLKSQKQLSKEAMEALKEGWGNLYANEDSVVILNNGMEFQEASSTSVEMQLNENKKTNSDAICSLFDMSSKMLTGEATEIEISNFVKFVLMPIIKAFESTLNNELLLESEKGSFYFVFDMKELLKGDIEKLFRAYKEAINSNIMSIDEVRYELDLKPLGFEYIKLGLQDVLLNPKTGGIYTPNMNATANLNGLNHLKGGET